jgi:adenine deaminase
MTADLCLINGRVVNVYSGEIIEQGVAVAGERIVRVGEVSDLIGDDTKVIDAAGDFVLPGFFDAHAHADLFYNPLAYAEHVLALGTTGFFNDGHDLCNALGLGPFLAVMDRLADSPCSVYTGLPAAAPPFPEIEGGELITDQDLAAGLTRPDAPSLSEVTSFLRVVEGEPTLIRRMAMARAANKLIEGHTTGANPTKLNALAAAGVTSCHESLTADDVYQRLRLGYAVMLRQGSIRRELPRLMEAVTEISAFDASRLMLVTDGVFPEHLLSRGNMDWVVAEAVELGLDPIRAIQMATLNPARYFRLDHLLGGVAPGRLAHLLVVERLENPRPRLVIAKGRLAARDGKPVESTVPRAEPGLGDRPFTLGRLEPEDFRVPVKATSGPAPVIKIVDQTVTAIEAMNLPAADGFYRAGGDLLTVTLFTRDGRQSGRGFLCNFADRLDGLASSVAHETHGLMVVGGREADMALAANHVLETGGGVTLVQDGRVKASLPLPLGGICSTESVPALARRTEDMNDHLRQAGCWTDYPLWTLGFLSFTSVLGVRITPSGVYDVKKREIIF